MKIGDIVILDEYPNEKWRIDFIHDDEQLVIISEETGLRVLVLPEEIKPVKFHTTSCF